MTASEYKSYKGLRKENLRDNMSDLEILLADIGEVTTRELARKHRPIGLEENKRVAQAGGKIAKNTRIDIEERMRETVITKMNSLGYQYEDEVDLIDNASK